MILLSDYLCCENCLSHDFCNIGFFCYFVIFIDLWCLLYDTSLFLQKNMEILLMVFSGNIMTKKKWNFNHKKLKVRISFSLKAEHDKLYSYWPHYKLRFAVCFASKDVM